MRWIALTLTVIIIASCLLACTPQQNVSRYTADQVIYVAKAKSPSCVREGAVASWDAQYMGDKKWLITKTCGGRLGYVFSKTYWYFYEDTGTLIQR
jgi:hypothetical protein